MFKTISNTDANLLNLHIDKATKTRGDKRLNHKNYNFLACNWFKNVLFFTNSLAKLLSDSLLLDSLLLDSLLSQSQSKMQFKSTNHIQSCNYVCARAVNFVFLPLTLEMFTPPLSVF